MKKTISAIATISLAAVLIFGSSLSAFAKEYVRDIIAEDFTSSKNCDFLPPGDIDKNGKLEDADVKGLTSQLFKGDPCSIYSDANGDNKLDLLDLIRQRKNIKANNFVSDNSMNFDGQTVCQSANLSKFGTGASYEISYSYKSDTPIKVQINGISGVGPFEDSASSSTVTANHTFKTPLSISDASAITLTVIGTGTVDNFELTRINMDNELEENW